MEPHRVIWPRYEAFGPYLNRLELKNEDPYPVVRMVKKYILKSIMVFSGKAYCKFLTFIGSTVSCSRNSCQNGGICFDDPNGFAFCNCSTNFTGNFCEIEIPSGNNVLQQISSVLRHCPSFTY